MKELKKLVLVGSGIKTISHLTIETQTYIKNADKVLYIANEPVFSEWIKKYTKNSESLEEIYFSFERRVDVYQAITEKIITELDLYNFICVVIYGHPTIFAKPGLDAILKVKDEGVETLILPGISAEDCLFSDLAVDPGENGCYSVEAMNFVLYDRVFDPYSDLILWQIGMVGNISHSNRSISYDCLEIILEKLLDSYPSQHQTFLYEASLYPGIKSRIRSFHLNLLLKQEITSISTLYIPAIKGKKINEIILERMRLTKNDLV